MAVPFGLGGFFMLLGLFGLFMSLAAGIRKTPSPVHLLCMILIALFLCFCGLSFIRVGSRGFIKEVVVTADNLVVHKVGREDAFLWAEIKTLASTDTGLNLRMLSGAEVEFGPSLENFDSLVAEIKERYRVAKGLPKLPPGI